MSTVIFRYEARRTVMVWLIFAAVLTMYTAMIIAMFDPKLGASLAQMQEAMPAVFAAVGMDNDATTSLVAFLNNYLFGFIYKAFPTVFIIFMVQRTVVRYLDRGTLATFLATGLSRRQIALTQVIILVGSVLLLLGYVVLLTCVISTIQFPGQLQLAAYWRLMLGLAALLAFELGVCYLAAVALTETSRALAVGAGLNVLFMLVQMIAGAGAKFANLRYFTPLSLFAQDDLLAGTATGWGGILLLLVAAVLLVGVGVRIFCQRDFSL